MAYEKRLLYRALDIIALVENEANQPLLNQAKGFIYEVISRLEK